MVIWVKIFKTEKTIEIHLVRLTEVCGKVISEKYAYKFVKTALLLSNVIDADHQNSCLFTNNGHFSLPLWGQMIVNKETIIKFHNGIISDMKLKNLLLKLILLHLLPQYP